MGLITWTDSLVNGDSVTQAHITNLKADVTNSVNGNLTNTNISASAAIAESKIAFDTSAGHDHDGTDSKLITSTTIIPRAYIQGAELVYVSSDTLKTTSGVVEINGTIYARTTDSTTIDISSDTNKVAGTANAASTWFYIYAYNDATTSWDIKWWNLAPQYANCGTDTSGPLIYRQSGGVWYRCIGVVFNDSGQDLDVWYQRGRIVKWDVPAVITTTISAGAWSSGATPCGGTVGGIPTVSTMGIFGGFSAQAAGQSVQLFLRPNGATSSTSNAEGMQGIETVAGELWCATDSSQQIDYYNGGSDSTTNIVVKGYVLDIR